MRWATALIVAALLVFAGCGGDDGPTEAEPDRPTETEQDAEVEGETIDAPTPTAEPAVVEPEPLTYVVQEGDLLGAIAQTFDVPLDALIEANKLENPDVLSIGQELIIPAPESPAESGAGDESDGAGSG